MKIVQILPELNAGGVERCAVEMAAHLVRGGHESIILSNGGRMVTDLEKAGSRHITMPVHRKAVASLLQVRPLRKFLTDEHPDILHIHSRVPGWLAWLAWRGMDPATRPGLVSTVHGFHSVNAYSGIMTKGERVIAVSQSIREYILKHYPKTDPAVIRVIPHGVDPEAYHAGFRPSAGWLAAWRAAHPTLAGKQVLLLPGRITRLKGHGEFFELISTLKREGLAVCGLIAGDTHPKKRRYLEELHQQAGGLGISGDIIFLGHRSDVREVMAISDIVFSLSQQPESFGLTVLEALALGKPVAGYDYGGVGELLDALLPSGKVPLGDTAGLVRVTRALLEERPQPLPVGGPYLWEAVCHATLDVYQELAAGPRQPFQATDTGKVFSR